VIGRLKKLKVSGKLLLLRIRLERSRERIQVRHNWKVSHSALDTTFKAMFS
jgi:hypothetical protein